MTKTRKLRVSVAGVKVCVRLGEDGRPLSAVALQSPRDLEHERLLTLAATKAFDATLSAAREKEARRSQELIARQQADIQATQDLQATRQAKLKRDSVNAAAKSAEKRAKASAKHWTNKWFKRAHAEHPGYGRARLAQHARRVAADAGVSLKKRDQITDDRARQFLERKRKRPASPKSPGRSAA
jgi:hypothetical protein